MSAGTTPTFPNLVRDAHSQHGPKLAVPEQEVEQLVLRMTPGATRALDLDHWHFMLRAHGLVDDADSVCDTLDWNGLHDESEVERQLDEWLDADRRQAFVPGAHARLAHISLPGNESFLVISLASGTCDTRALATLVREGFGGEAPAGSGGTRSRRQGERRRATAAHAFWRDYFHRLESPSRFELPPVVDGEGYGCISRVLDADVSEKLRALQDRAQVTLHNVVQGGWSLLLSTCLASDDIVFGSVRHARRGPAASASGNFANFRNLLPLRVRIDPEANVFELLWQVRDRHRQLHEHEHDRLADIERGLNDDELVPLFDSVLDFDQRDPVSILDELLQNKGVRPVLHRVPPVSSVHIKVHGGARLQLHLHYRREHISEESAERMLSHFSRLLARMSDNPRQPVCRIDGLSVEEREPVRWPGPQRLSASGNCESLHDTFNDRARRNPEAIALAFGNRQMTYGELEERATRLAHRLLEDGVQPGERVGLCMDRSPEQIVGLLGILKAGAAYVPLDPNYPRERLAFIVEDAGIRNVVMQAAWRDRLPANGLHCIEPLVEGDDDDVSRKLPAVSGEALAYVIYTSGSTGKPKGVLVTHHNVLRLFDACRSWLQPGVGDVWTLFHSFAFDFSVWEIWGALLYGGRLEIVPREVARSPEAFRELVAERGVTVLSQTPSAFRELGRADAAAGEALSSLRLVIFGGEKLDIRELREWVRRYGDEHPRLINMYGITETTVHVTYRPITERDTETAKGSLIGWPLPDLYVRLLDRHDRPVPKGVRGEICVGGAGVARGYLNRPELDAARFTADPLLPAGRLYRSGDFARQMPDGELCYLGRDDDQVKIRGFRIDLGEIASSLREIDGVEDAVVVAHQGSGGERRLAAYYVPSTPGSLSADALRRTLSAKLPEHMLPAYLVPLINIPLNANSKVDFRALPDPATAVAEESRGAAPETPAERILASIWSEVLERAVVGRDDDFFGLGGDSILALKVVTRARARGFSIVPRDLFEHSVLRELAARVRLGRDVAEDGDTLVNMDGHLELAPMQRWFLEQSFECPDHFNRAVLFQVPPDTNIEALEASLREVVRRHDALHVRIIDGENGKHARRVRPEEALEFSRIELDHLDEEERREAVALITEDIQQSLSLSSGLLVRAAHFSGGLDTGHRLLITIHGMAIDDASWQILLREVEQAYRALSAGRQPEFRNSSMPFAEVAARLKAHGKSMTVRGEQAYWQKLVECANDVPLALDAAPGCERDERVLAFTLDSTASAALESDAHAAYGTDSKELLLAALGHAVHARWPQSACLRVDVQDTLRDAMPPGMDCANTVGWLDVLQPLALELATAGNVARLVCDTKAAVRGVRNKGLAFSLLQLVESCIRQRPSAVAPVLLQLRDTAAWHAAPGFLRAVREDMGPTRSSNNALPYPLTISVEKAEGRFEVELRYDSTRVSREQAQALCQAYEDSLDKLIAHCRNHREASRSTVDFPLANLSQASLDAFPVDLAAVEDILRLSPIQRLYHAWAGSDRDKGFDHWLFSLGGHINEAAFERAWQQVLQRHEALRTIFVDEGLDEPHQVVMHEVPFRLQRADWRNLDMAAQEERLQEFLAADLRQPFDPARAPLTRATLIRRADDAWWLVWTHHKLQVDGWSWPVLAAELGEIHDAEVAGREPELPAPGSYRNYVRWLLERDVEEYAAFWRERLEPVAGQPALITRVPGQGSSTAEGRSVVRHEFNFSESFSNRLREFARRLRLTPSVLFQAAWSVVVSGLSGRRDVTVGVAFSGRTAGIPVAEHTVGPFVNNLPVPVRVDPQARADEWLKGLRTSQAQINHYQNVSPGELHEWTGRPAGRRFFDTLLVFQNYATGDATRRWGSNIRVDEFNPGVATNFPLTISITPGQSFRIELVHLAGALQPKVAHAIARDLQEILELLLQRSDRPVADLLACFEDRDAQVEEPVRLGCEPAASPLLAKEGAPGGSASMVAAVCGEVLGSEIRDRSQNFFDAGVESVSLIEIHRRIQEQAGRRFPIVRMFEHPSVAALARFLDGAGDVAVPRAAQRAAQRRAALQQRQARQRGGAVRGE